MECPSLTEASKSEGSCLVLAIVYESSVTMRTVLVSPKFRTMPSSGGSGGTRHRNSGGRSSRMEALVVALSISWP